MTNVRVLNILNIMLISSKVCILNFLWVLLIRRQMGPRTLSYWWHIPVQLPHIFKTNSGTVLLLFSNCVFPSFIGNWQIVVIHLINVIYVFEKVILTLYRSSSLRYACVAPLYKFISVYNRRYCYDSTVFELK